MASRISTGRIVIENGPSSGAVSPTDTNAVQTMSTAPSSLEMYLRSDTPAKRRTLCQSRTSASRENVRKVRPIDGDRPRGCSLVGRYWPMSRSPGRT